MLHLKLFDWIFLTNPKNVVVFLLFLSIVYCDQFK